jgi:hypothetical protein
MLVFACLQYSLLFKLYVYVRKKHLLLIIGCITSHTCSSLLILILILITHT